MKKLIGKESGDIIFTDKKKNLLLLINGENRPCSYYIMEDRIILVMDNGLAKNTSYLVEEEDINTLKLNEYEDERDFESEASL